MAHVIVGEKKIGRPIRLEHRRFETRLAELVLVAVNQIGIGMRLQNLHNLKERIWLQDIIVIEKSDPLPARERESAIRRSRNASVFSEARQDDPLVAPGKLRQNAQK